MKKILSLLLSTAILGLSGAAYGQNDRSGLGKNLDQVTDTVSMKVKKQKNKNAVPPVDQPYNDMVGPEGQTVYIDKDARYYYIDEKGDRIYVNKSDLKGKPR